MTLGDVIVMKSGQRIEGEVLKVQKDVVFVDVGVDVVKVPVDQIQERISKEPVKEDVQAAADGIFMSADLPERTVKELVDKYGEGVVLIQNPGGLGSGFIINDRGYCVTNYHVVEEQTRVAVTIFHRSPNGDFERRAIRDVKILALNPYFDLALLEIPAQKDLKFQPVYIADDDSHTAKATRCLRSEVRLGWNDLCPRASCVEKPQHGWHRVYPDDGSNQSR